LSRNLWRWIVVFLLLANLLFFFWPRPIPGPPPRSAGVEELQLYQATESVLPSPESADEVQALADQPLMPQEIEAEPEAEPEDAVPREGWRFVEWQGWCAPQSVDPLCEMNASAASVALWDSLHPDVNMPELTAVFEPEGALALYREQVEEVDQYLVDIEFSGSVLVSIGDDTLLARGYGLADQAKGYTNKQNTRFRIASLTKPFTAASIMMLEERQLLSTGDQICDYLDDCPAAWQAVTLHQLLSHTSGIPDLFRDIPTEEAFGLMWNFDVTQTSVLNTFLELPLEFSPGTEWEYSNSGYFLLGLVIEAVSGTSYSQFLEKNIFEPLGMSNTGASTVRRSQLAVGYDAGFETPQINPIATFSSGSVYSTVVDLRLWERAMHSDVLLSDSTREKYLSAYVDTFCPGSCVGGQAYGWIRENWDGLDILLHSGWLPGWRSGMFSSFQDEYPSIIVLQNTSTDGPEPVLLGLDIGRMISGYDPRN
jgi:CubicO group peptidase (beta-lactamase class C family)